MIDDKKRAEAQAALDYGIAATQMLVNILESPTAKLSPDGGLSLALIEEGALAATFAAKEAIIASAPTYATGVGSHPGGFAVVGDFAAFLDQTRDFKGFWQHDTDALTYQDAMI